MNKRIKRKRNKRMSLLTFKGLSLKESRYHFNRENVRCEYEYLCRRYGVLYRYSNEPKYNKTNLKRALRCSSLEVEYAR